MRLLLTAAAAAHWLVSASAASANASMSSSTTSSQPPPSLNESSAAPSVIDSASATTPPPAATASSRPSSRISTGLAPVTPSPTSSNPATPTASQVPQPTTATPTISEGSCRDLPRNTVLASCPLPCLADAPCIVYDQDPDHTQLTGCDHDTASNNSFCTSMAGEMCEFHCFGRDTTRESFNFLVNLEVAELGEPRPRTAEDMDLLNEPVRGSPYQANNFVRSVGRLNLSTETTAVEISGGVEDDSDRRVDLDVDVALLADAPSVTTLILSGIPLGDDRAFAIVASVSSHLKKLMLEQSDIETVSWKQFASVPELEELTLRSNKISLISDADSTMPALTHLDLGSNLLTGFGVQAPMLTHLDLTANQLVRIPESVYTYTKLESLLLFLNPIIKPLVLSAEQLELLEALPQLMITVFDPVDPAIVSRLPTTGGSFGDYHDDVDISLLLEGGIETVLRGESRLKVTVVSAEKAAQYNQLLELRARNYVKPIDELTLPPRTPAPTSVLTGGCLDFPRNTLLASCPAPCLDDAPCIVYDQDPDHTQLTGCDYDTTNQNSFCISKPDETCEFHCFGRDTTRESFRFWVNLEVAELGESRPRTAEDVDMLNEPRNDSPRQVNNFVRAIGRLNVSAETTKVEIFGGYEDSSERKVEVDVDATLLASAPSVTWLILWNIPLTSDRVAAIMASVPPGLKKLELPRLDLEAMSWEVFGTVPELEELTMRENRLSLVSGADFSMPSLTYLQLSENKLTAFDLQAPMLTKLELAINKLARIPESVFTYTKLDSLDLRDNPVIKPLVLSAQQLAFLEALPGLEIALVEPTDTAIVSRLPSTMGSFGDYWDDVDISLLLEGGTKTFLHEDSSLPVIVVDEDKAAQYNHLLELRALNYVQPVLTFPPRTPSPTSVFKSSCLDFPRNTVLASCPLPCLVDAPCIVYDQDPDHTQLTGCDHDTASNNSFCTSMAGEMCEFHCFGRDTTRESFNFLVNLEVAELGEPRPRTAEDMDLLNEPVRGSPYQANNFVRSVGRLNLSTETTAVGISGKKKTDSREQIVVDVDANLLANAPAVTSLSLSNIRLGTSRAIEILASAPRDLKKLDLSHTFLETVSWEMFESLPELEELTLRDNRLTVISGADFSLPALTFLSVGWGNALTGFDVHAPMLTELEMAFNSLVRIPESVFTYTKLESLDLRDNPVIKPLVLSAQQLAFLEALPGLEIALVEPTDTAIVSRLPSTMGSFGDYWDDVDISLLLEGGTKTFLHEDSSLPVIVVDEDKAAQYNQLLELRARNYIVSSCDSLPRNKVLASCPAPCLPDTPCIIYDQNANHTQLTGCDYGTTSSNSFCSSTRPQTCEFHCFGKNTDPSAFGFRVGLKSSPLGNAQPRSPVFSRLITKPSDVYPFQSNDFVSSVGELNVSNAITTIEIVGARKPISIDFVDVAVDSSLLANAQSITSLALVNLQLGSDLAAAIIAFAPPTLMKLNLTHTNITTIAWTKFASAPKIETRLLADSSLSAASADASGLPALTELYVSENNIERFDVRAPDLKTLDLRENKLVRIPESVFSYSKLESLQLTRNWVIRPLVLTVQQLQFLEALPRLAIDVVDPFNAAIVSQVPADTEGFGKYSDDIDIRSYLVGATNTTLRGDPSFPVFLVDSVNAKLYNDLLEIRSVYFGVPDLRYLPADMCPDLPRNALLSSCAPGYCPSNGACVAFDPISILDSPSGCDYDLASTPSFCTTVNGKAKTCNFQCFGAYTPQSQFKFFVPFKTTLGQTVARKPFHNDLENLKTAEIPFLSNSILTKIGTLNLTSSVTEVLIAGGRSEKETTTRLAELSVDPKLLSRSPSVTSLSLLNIDLSKSDLIGIVASASTGLTSLDLRNTNLIVLPEEIFAYLQQLQSLSLAQNGLTSFTTGAMALPKLTKLDLSRNSLTMIDVKAPNLRTLDLSGNNLVRIPLSVFSLTRLTTLNLNDNPLALPLVLSPPQLAFLSSVSIVFDSVSGMGLSQRGLVIPVQLDDGSVVNGTAAMVGGIPVVIVDEQVANQYNDQLEKKQETSTEPSTRSTDRAASATLNATVLSSDNSSVVGSSSTGGSEGGSYFIQAGSTNLPSGTDRTSAHDETKTPAGNATSSVSISTKLLLGALGSAFIVAVVVLLFIIAKRRRRNASPQSFYIEMVEHGDEEAGAQPLASGAKMIPWWSDEDMLSHRLNAGGISDVRAIGSGGSGIVWLVNYRGGTRQLVSKRVILGEGPAYDAKVLQLFGEAKIASSLKYPSIVPFVGVAWTDKTDLQVLYEYMPNGDLSSFLARTDPATLPWIPQKLQLAIDIIEALVYAHSFNPPLLHRDLKASNVLLDKKNKAKLGDFGSARPESDSNTMTTNEVGTGRWLAPEILLGSTSYGSSSDIYSFGVVLCELDTHQVPYAEEAQVVSSESVLLQQVASGTLRPSVSSSCPPEIQEMAEACLAFDPEERPTAMQVSYKLRSLLRQNRQS